MTTVIKCSRILSLCGILLAGSPGATAQVNPFIYFRISHCDNCKVTAYVNESVLLKDGCSGQLAWNPILLNPHLQQKNKLRFELGNEKPNEFYGSFVFELLRVDSVNGVFKRFFWNEVKLEDHDRFQLNIDNLLKKQGWNYTYQNAGQEPLEFLARGNRKDSLDYFFKKVDRYYIVITAAKHAVYSVSLNQQKVLGGELHISNLADAYALANYPYFFLNSLDKSVGKVVMNYTLEPRDDKHDGYLEIFVQHLPPGVNEPNMVAICKIECPKGDMKAGELDLTEPLQRKGFFIR